MSTIDFISHEEFPEDEYTKELVYLCLDSKYRVAYVRKKAKSGGLFWSVASTGATKNGQKEYYPAFIQDSNFLERDIKDFLEKRKWESARSVFSDTAGKPGATASAFAETPRSMSDIVDSGSVPF